MTIRGVLVDFGSVIAFLRSRQGAPPLAALSSDSLTADRCERRVLGLAARVYGPG